MPRNCLVPFLLRPPGSDDERSPADLKYEKYHLAIWTDSILLISFIYYHVFVFFLRMDSMARQKNSSPHSMGFIPQKTRPAKFPNPLDLPDPFHLFHPPNLPPAKPGPMPKNQLRETTNVDTTVQLCNVLNNDIAKTHRNAWWCSIFSKLNESLSLELSEVICSWGFWGGPPWWPLTSSASNPSKASNLGSSFEKTTEETSLPSDAFDALSLPSSSTTFPEGISLADLALDEAETLPEARVSWISSCFWLF